MYNKDITPNAFNEISQGHFPGELKIKITDLQEGCMKAEMPIEEHLFAPNGFMHAGSIVTFADTVAGYSTVAHLPNKATSFTTLELKSNFMGSAKEGALVCESSVEHMGRTTQVWRVEVRSKSTGKKVAIFSCTQLILY